MGMRLGLNTQRLRGFGAQAAVMYMTVKTAIFSQDTLLLMGLKEEYEEARGWVATSMHLHQVCFRGLESTASQGFASVFELYT